MDVHTVVKGIEEDIDRIVIKGGTEDKSIQDIVEDINMMIAEEMKEDIVMIEVKVNKDIQDAKGDRGVKVETIDQKAKREVERDINEVKVETNDQKVKRKMNNKEKKMLNNKEKMNKKEEKVKRKGQ